MVTPNAGNFEALRRAVTQGGFNCEARRAHDVSMALARVAGGGVQAVVFDVSGPGEGLGKTAGLTQFRQAQPAMPLLIWSVTENAELAALVSQTGASGYITRESNPAEWKEILCSKLRSPEPPERPLTINPNPTEKASVIAVMGAKGGVGTTTVAINVAAALTARGRVILAEIRPCFGSLQVHFRPGRRVRGLANWQAGADSGVTSLLWPSPSTPRLRVLFGPQQAEDCRQLEPGDAVRILRHLAAEADFVVVDLAVSLSEANRAILGASHYMMLVLEPSSAGVRLGKLTLEGIQNWDRTPASIGAVVVKRTVEGVPIPLPEIESELGVSILKVIPPAPELCVQSERERVPMVQCESDNLAADNLIALAQCFHSQGAYFKPA